MSTASSPRPRPTVLGVLGLLAFASVLTAAGCIWVILGRSTNPLWSRRTDVILPDLSGMTRAEAEALPETAALAVTWEEVYNPAVTPGEICGQQPAAGRTVKAGQALTVQISLGTDWISMPDLTGQNRDEALAALHALQLSPVVEFESDNTVAAYTVLRTEPAAGEQLAAGSAVKVTVIRPLPDPNRPIPNVQGMALDAARDALQQAGLTAVVAGGATEGTVTAQDPIPGNLVKVFSPVTIYCR